MLFYLGMPVFTEVIREFAMKNIMPARFWKRNVGLRVQGSSLRGANFRDQSGHLAC